MTAAEPASQPVASLMGMEAASRWETEAIRESRDRRRGRPSVSQQRTTASQDGDWRTLREASDETGIPIGTLRKWCRRESVDSYLESDGELTLRMLEMGSVKSRAETLGKDLEKAPAGSEPPATSSEPVLSTQYSVPSTADEVGSTMIVPVDAWSKMLTQLGNLHEAGQQLAEARERAGKAETEAKFLRERLAEMRESYRPPADPVPPAEGRGDAKERSDDAGGQESRQPPATSFHQPGTGDLPSTESSSSAGQEIQRTTDNRQQTEPDPVPQTGPESSSSAGQERQQTTDHRPQTEPTPVPPAEGRGDSKERSDDAGGQETTSFWRYVVRGWKGRRR